MAIKRKAYKKEPILRTHRYVCEIGEIKKNSTNVAYKYVFSLKEANAVKAELKPGQTMNVFRATHNFIKAFECE